MLIDEQNDDTFNDYKNIACNWTLMILYIKRTTNLEKRSTTL
jgi:hypothetical protein